ncbi:hypothetical protein NE237_001935 [Protea cynaroides]|uniref:Ethylene receptor 1-like N-terminal domain-containing protein n=1 Tax=Protea cynaroides TaxID=273540 RepID=A0A9Q0QYX0_9MAGN|nr:hypothetical protein NE237_001935 [Protea cynaroides]
MESCNCIPRQWPVDEILMKYQFISDFFIALAYFSIPLLLIYFIKKSAIFPYRWVLVQFGAFIVLCGSTHLINLWTFNPYSSTVAVVMTIAKVLTAVVSCATAFMLLCIIPDLLDVKTRELVFKNKVAELDVQKKKQASMIESFQMVQVAMAISHATILEESMRNNGSAHGAKCSTGFGKERGENCHSCSKLILEQRLMVETILKGSILLAALINDVLDLSRLENGSLELELELVTFNLPAVNPSCTPENSGTFTSSGFLGTQLSLASDMSTDDYNFQATNCSDGFQSGSMEVSFLDCLPSLIGFFNHGLAFQAIEQNSSSNINNVWLGGGDVLENLYKSEKERELHKKLRFFHLQRIRVVLPSHSFEKF